MGAMHILLNGLFWGQPTVGMGQYLHSLLAWLPRVAPHHRYTLLLPASSSEIPALPVAVSPLTLRTPFDGRNDNLAKLWFAQVGVPQVAAMLARGRSGDTLLHVPYFAPPARCAVPVVVTIPDIIPLLLPAYRGGPHVRSYMALVRRTARHARAVLTLSHHSRRDIVAHLDIPAERVVPTPLAADECYTPGDPAAAAQQVAARYSLHAPFIYYVGGLDERKNVAVLLRALALLRAWGEPLPTLALAGRAAGHNRRLFPDVDSAIRREGVADLVRRIDVPREDGALLYRACTLFAYPSRYEGFGLPPLEAMACGAPVVASSTTSLPEVVGDAAITLDPDRAEGWAAAFSRLLHDPALRAQMRQQSLARAATFSWRSVAQQTTHVYQAALHNAPLQS